MVHRALNRSPAVTAVRGNNRGTSQFVVIRRGGLRRTTENYHGEPPPPRPPTAVGQRTAVRIEDLQHRIFRIRFRRSIEETPICEWGWITGRNNGLKRATHILDSLRSFFVVYVCSNKPVKLKSVPRLDPRTDVDCRILLATTVKDPHTVEKLLAACQTSLDPTEY